MFTLFNKSAILFAFLLLSFLALFSIIWLFITQITTSWPLLIYLKKPKKTKQLSSSICRYYIKHWRMDSPIPSNKLWAGECGWLWVVQVVGDNKSKYHTNSSPGGSFPKMKCIIQWRNISCESQFGTIKAGTSSSSKMNIKTENLRLWRFKKMYTITR